MNNIGATALQTERLILREFTEKDIPALFSLLNDKEANTFLPWFPVQSLTEAREFYERRIATVYRQRQGYYYAVCLKKVFFIYLAISFCLCYNHFEVSKIPLCAV